MSLQESFPKLKRFESLVCPGGNSPEGKFLGGNCPGGNFRVGNVFGWEVPGGKLSGGNCPWREVVRGGNYPGGVVRGELT